MSKILENADDQKQVNSVAEPEVKIGKLVRNNSLEELRVFQVEVTTRWSALKKQRDEAESSARRIRVAMIKKRGWTTSHLAAIDARHIALCEYIEWLDSYISGNHINEQRVKLGELLSANAIIEANVLANELARGLLAAEYEVKVQRNAMMNLETVFHITSSPLGLSYEYTDSYGRVNNGKTPKTVEIPLGKMELIVKSPGRGWPDDRRDFYVNHEEETKYCAVFASAAVRITSDPTGLAFEISNRSGFSARGHTPTELSDVPVGLVTLKISNAGWSDFLTQTTIKTGQLNELSATYKLGDLTVISDPSGADVSIDGINLGRTPLTLRGLRPGTKSIVLKIDGYYLYSANKIVEPGSATSMFAKLDKVALPVVGRVYKIPSLALELVPIQSGSFMMGRLPGEGIAAPDERRVPVTLSKNFWLGRTEVTQAQWTAVMGKNPSFVKGDLLPVDYVSYSGAIEFCRLLTSQERQNGRLPEGYFYTLPTEAQWEYACRAGAHDFIGGILPTAVLGEAAWYSENSGKKLKTVGTKQANAWGLYDMLGNVWEWCLDWQGDLLGGNDPEGPSTGDFRVYRGGSCNSNQNSCYPMKRMGHTPEYTGRNLGFRIALIASP